MAVSALADSAAALTIRLANLLIMLTVIAGSCFVGVEPALQHSDRLCRPRDFLDQVVTKGNLSTPPGP